MSAALLLLADARFPSGAHAHSHGVEAAIGVGDIRTVEDLAAFVERRLHTVGRVDAAFAAAAAGSAPDFVGLDEEYAARTMAPALRTASRSLGRQLLRSARHVWPSPAYTTAGPSPFHPIAMGTVAAAAGLGPREAALCTLHHLTGGLSTAAVRLLGLDPFAVAAVQARCAVRIDELSSAATSAARGPIASLPARVDLEADLLAEHHATWEVRLFAS